MADKYHISPTTGNPNKCYASKKPCPVGGASEHYPTKEAAQAAYEKRNRATTVPTAVKKTTPSASAKPASKPGLPTAPAKSRDFQAARARYPKGPEPTEVKKLYEASTRHGHRCSQCGEETGGWDGYSSCCNQPMTLASFPVPATYRYTFKSYEDANSFVRENHVPGYQMHYDTNFRKMPVGPATVTCN